MALGLHFILTPELLEGGEALVTCTALIPNVYEEEVQTVLSTRPPHHASVMAAAPVTGSRPTLAAVILASLLQSLFGAL